MVMDIPIKSMNYRWQHDITGMILFNIKTNQSYRLNETAFEVWNLCDGELDKAAIIEAIAEKYTVDEAVICEDIEETLQFMKEQNMVVMNETAI